VKVVASHRSSSALRPTNQRNSRLLSISSISKRSLRIEYSIYSNCARNSFSGAIDGRPTWAYIVSKRRETWLSTSFTMARIACLLVQHKTVDLGVVFQQPARRSSFRELCQTLARKSVTSVLPPGICQKDCRCFAMLNRTRHSHYLKNINDTVFASVL